MIKNQTNTKKIEVSGDTNSDFANNVCGLKVIVKGNIGNNSAHSVQSSKFTVFDSCGEGFGVNAKSSEFYIFKNCGKDSFVKLTSNSKVIVGGVIGANSGAFANGIFIILNLNNEDILIDNDTFKDAKGLIIYFRGDKDKIKIVNKKLLLEKIGEDDEDIYLPLISEFARLFDFSLSEIKSKPFSKVVIK